MKSSGYDRRMVNLFPLNLSEINHLSLPQRPVLTTAECKETFSVFDQNIASTIGLSLVPGISALLSLHMMEAMERAHQKFDLVPDTSRNEEERKEREDRIWDLGCIELQQIARSQEDNWHDGVSNYTEKLDRISPMFKAQTHEFLHGILKSITVQSWTALETMSKDLWERVRDSTNQSIVRPSLKERKRDNLWFSSRAGIRRCYDFSFKCQQINDAIHETEIDALALLRNVIVHSAGRVDQNFQDEFANFNQFSALASLSKTDMIPVDGKLVISVIQPAIKAAYNLSFSVDDWLKINL